MIIKNFSDAEQFLALHIPRSSEQTFPGQLGLNRAKYFLHLLGRPQEKIKVIHVAGTSGKGSTCYLINRLLVSHGFKVGLHQSPHLTDVRERYQINNKIISKKEFIFYLNKVIPFVENVARSEFGKLSYFEILVGMAFLIFSEKKVDYAIIETGLGGKYDGTNVVMRKDKLSVLTRLGLDHTNILGKTIEKIAIQKAMIINKNSQAISIYQDKKVEKIIREVAEKKKANIIFVESVGVDPRVDPSVISNRLGLIGDYQMENANLALAAVKYLGQRDKFILDKKIVNKVFETADFPGRFDIKKINGKTVIFDGAHNPQKMDAFIRSLIKKYPNEKFNFLLAFKKGKDYGEMLKTIISSAAVHKIIFTGFLTEDQDMINASEDPITVSNQLNQLNWSESVESVGIDSHVDPSVISNRLNTKIIPDLRKAWEELLKEEGPVVVTGSLYLVGEIFKLINLTNTTNGTNPTNK